MLVQLFIKNYAIIEELTIDFTDHLNVITGETGAGKSIILGATSLILGDRADTSVLINKEEKCIVEAVFNIKGNEAVYLLLQQEDLDREEQLIIRREINSSGKSRAFINDTPVNLNTLNQFTNVLVDLHRQFDNRLVERNEFLYQTVDAFSDNVKLFQQFSTLFQQYKLVQVKLNQLIQQQQAWNNEAEYKQFLYDELLSFDLKINEIETLEEQVKQLAHVEQIKSALEGIHYFLEGDEQSFLTLLHRSNQQLEQVIPYYGTGKDLSERLQSVYLELKDIAEESLQQQQKIMIDPEALANSQERLNEANRLLKKHQVISSGELIDIQLKLSDDLAKGQSSNAAAEELRVQLDGLTDQITIIAAQLSEKRNNHIPRFEARINELLDLVGMPNAKIQIQIRESEALHEYGKDNVAFLLDANKSGQYLPLSKAASGGELSRIMLCVKTLTAQLLELPTLIFDEVDAGISGEAAKQVGLLLKSLGQQHQIICITHQPQVASKGDKHFFVYKQMINGKVTTLVRSLDTEERIRSIAQMIGGDQPSEAALFNARELVMHDV